MFFIYLKIIVPEEKVAKGELEREDEGRVIEKIGQDD